MSRDIRAEIPSRPLDVRTDVPTRAPGVRAEEPARTPEIRVDREDAARTPEIRAERDGAGRTPRVPMDGLALPRADTRERVAANDRVYFLRGSETRVLVTVGAFRLVPAEQLVDVREKSWKGDLRRLGAQGLIERKTVIVNHQPVHLVVLSSEGLALLTARQQTGGDRTPQQYHAGWIKPRETAHDAQLHRLFQAEGSRIEAAGGRIERVVLDDELKRDYQVFLNRRDRPAGATIATEMRAFAAARGLPVVDGHLKLPDLRIEYETAEGRHETRDVELVTEHYSWAQLAGKVQAGFSRYRAAGSAAGRQGGTPRDPHHLQWLG